MSFWTRQKVEACYRAYVVEGKSAAVTAVEIGAETRNMVIGKVNRMGWSRGNASVPGRAKPPMLAKVHIQRRAAIARNKQAPAPRNNKPGLTFDGPVAPTPVLLCTSVESPNAKPWLGREAKQCAFPVSGEGTDTVSCCNPAEAVYCPGHMAIAYVKGTASTRKDTSEHKLKRIQWVQANGTKNGWMAEWDSAA